MRKKLMGLGMVVLGSTMYLKGLKAAAEMGKEFDSINVHSVEYDKTLETLNERVMREGLIKTGCKTYDGVRLCLAQQQHDSLWWGWANWRRKYHDDSDAWVNEPRAYNFDEQWSKLNIKQREALNLEFFERFRSQIDSGKWKWDNNYWMSTSGSFW